MKEQANLFLLTRLVLRAYLWPYQRLPTLAARLYPLIMWPYFGSIITDDQGFFDNVPLYLGSGSEYSLLALAWGALYGFPDEGYRAPNEIRSIARRAARRVLALAGLLLVPLVVCGLGTLAALPGAGAVIVAVTEYARACLAGVGR